MADSNFRASGLASGMDTASIVDQLVALESRPLAKLQTRQSGLKTQISALADIISKLNALSTAAKDLGTNGVFATRSASINDAFAATPGTAAVPGRYRVEVKELAQASKWRSGAFGPGEAMAGGSLQLTVQGTTYDPITIADSTSLADVAYAIRQSGAPVSAVVLSDGTSSYLSVTAQDTGFPLDETAADALQVALTPDGGATGKLPAFAEIEPATNALVAIDGLDFTRTSNSLSDALPGVTLALKKKAVGAPEDLVVATDNEGTKVRLQKFVDAYNDVMKLVQRQLAVTKDTDRTRTLAGDGSVRALQAELHRAITAKVPELENTGVRTLADLGVKTARDGSLSIDTAALDRALSRDPAAVNALFSTASSGLAAVVEGMVTAQTRSGDGVLVARQDGLDRTVKDLDKQAEAMQRRLDAFRENLVKQFTAMENTVSGLKSIGSFLSNWTIQSSSK
jgi:flagellar hook-associated protein 2